MPEIFAAIPAILAGGAGTAGAGIDLGAMLGGLGSLFGFGGDAAAAGAAGAGAAGGLDLATIPGAAGLADAGAAAGAAGAGAAGAGAGGGLLAGLGDVSGLAGMTALAPDLGAAGVATGAPLDLAGAAGGAAGSGVGAAAPTAGGAIGAAGGATAAASPASVAAPAADLTSLLSSGPASTALQAGDTAATGGFAGDAGGGGLSGILSSAGGQIAKNPLGTLGAVGSGGLLLSDVLRGNQKPEGYGQLQAQANQANQQAGQLEGYLTSGQLPAGVQASLDAAKQSAIAAVKNQYATRGMSGSSAEQQDLAGIEQQVAGQGATIAQNLYNTGLSQAQLSDQIYSELMRTMVEQDQQTSQAVGNFAGSLALMGARGGV